jgi:hypothetical protein
LPINYFEVESDYLAKSTSYEERFVSKLSNIADKFEQMFVQLVVMFQSEDKIFQWKPALEEYIKDDIRRRFG